MINLSLIIPAAGSGVRMGSEVPKPFIELGGKTIIEHTIEKFVNISGLKQVIVVTSAQYISTVKKLISNYDNTDIQFLVVEGGAERQHSISNALEYIDQDVKLIAVHDAVRPFIKPEHVVKCCEVAIRSGGAVLGIPVRDTIKKVDEDLSIISTPDRSNLWQVQTPQVFKRDLFIEAYKKGIEEDFIGTDDSSLVERLGVNVKMIKGEVSNFKITYPIDMTIAKLMIEGQYE